MGLMQNSLSGASHAEPDDMGSRGLNHKFNTHHVMLISYSCEAAQLKTLEIESSTNRSWRSQCIFVHTDRCFLTMHDCWGGLTACKTRRAIHELKTVEFRMSFQVIYIDTSTLQTLSTRNRRQCFKANVTSYLLCDFQTPYQQSANSHQNRKPSQLNSPHLDSILA
jgi:hypothetical protein